MKKKLIFVVLWLAVFRTAPPGQQQKTVELPQTPAGRHVEAYLKAFNAGEPAMREFFAGRTAKDALQKTPVEARLSRYLQMRERLGTLALRKVVESRDDLVVIVAHGSSGPIVQLDFQFEPADPFGLLSIRLLDIGEESAPADPKKNNAELASAVKEYAKKISQADEFSGVILVANKGIVLFEEAYGYADRERKIPNRMDTKFNIGSINKSFTSIAVRQLIEQKKISLDDTIGRFFPNYPDPEAAAKVTVRHLLDMTSGIGDFFGDRYAATPKENIRALKDYLPLFADKPLEFEPGTRRLYSNGGYIILGLIVEKASGMDYYTYVRERIFKPASMFGTESFEKDADVPNRAVGYVLQGSARKTNYDTLPGRGSSAGGGYSTAHDLLKYVIALDKGTLAGSSEDLKGGFGIAGGAPGLNAAVEWDPQTAYAIIVLSNFDPPAAERVARQIRSWLPH